MRVEGDGGAPLRRERGGGRRKQLGRARWRWGRKERRTSVSDQTSWRGKHKQTVLDSKRGGRDMRGKGEEVEEVRRDPGQTSLYSSKTALLCRKMV